MIKFIKINILLLIFSTSLIGQDALFSQFYHNPLHTNPAFTGIFNSKYRIGSSIRKQANIYQGIAYNSKSIFADLRYNIVKKDYISIGFIMIDDHAGLQKIGKSNGYLSISYSKHLAHNKYSHTNQYLVLGIQTGFGKTYIGGDDFLFGIQFDKTSENVDPTIPNGENDYASILYPDINLGLMWYYSNRYNSVYVGFGLQHINSPNISYFPNSVDKLPTRTSMILGGEINIAKGLSLLPASYTNIQGANFQSLIGANFRYEYDNLEENAFRIGLWSRISNSIENITFSDLIISSIVEFNRIEIGFSYDITMSNLNLINDRKGAFEISLIYTWGENPKYNPINCPKF